MGRRSHNVSVYVDVDLDDFDDEDIKDEYEARFGGGGNVAFDDAREIRNHLCCGRINDAIALCDNLITAAMVSDDSRQRQYQMAGRIAA